MYLSCMVYVPKGIPGFYTLLSVYSTLLLNLPTDCHNVWCFACKKRNFPYVIKWDQLVWTIYSCVHHWKRPRSAAFLRRGAQVRRRPLAWEEAMTAIGFRGIKGYIIWGFPIHGGTHKWLVYEGNFHKQLMIWGYPYFRKCPYSYMCVFIYIYITHTISYIWVWYQILL